jgi:hypothetical protein
MNKNLLTFKINWPQLSFYLLILSLLLVQAAFFIFYVPDQVTQIFKAREAVDKDAAEINNLAAALAKIQTIDAQSLSRYLAVATAALPDEKKTSGMVTGMTNLASTYGIGVKSLEFSPGLISSGSANLTNLPTSQVTLGGGVKQITASLTIFASIPSLIAFLEGLEKTSQMIGVNSVELGDNAQRSEVSLQLQIYYQPPRSFNPDTAAKDLKLLGDEDVALLESLPEEDIFTVLPE